MAEDAEDGHDQDSNSSSVRYSNNEMYATLRRGKQDIAGVGANLKHRTRRAPRNLLTVVEPKANSASVSSTSDFHGVLEEFSSVPCKVFAPCRMVTF